MDRNRRQFLAEGMSLALLSSRAAATAEPAVCLVAPGPLDVVGVFDELGLRHEIVGMENAARIPSENFALLWVAAPSYPEPVELPPDALKKIERFLQTGKGVFAEFVTNFPAAPADDAIQKTGIARLFVANPLGVPDRTPAGTILDEHDSMCLPMSGDPEGLKEVLSFGRVAGVERIVPNFRPAETWPGLLWGQKGPGRFAFATTSLSEFRRREYAPLAHWERILRELVLALLPETERSQVLKRYIPLRAYTEPRVWVLPETKFQVVVETSNAKRVEVVSPARMELAPAASGRWEGELKAGQPGVMRVVVKVTGNESVRAADPALRVMDRKAAYRRALERNIRWFERSGLLLRPDGTLGVFEWISGPNMDGNRVAFGAENIRTPERTDCLVESALAFWLYGKLADSPRHRGIGENMLIHAMDNQRLTRGDKRYGLWYSFGREGAIFLDDTGWATICSLAGYRYMKNKMFRRRGLISAEAQTRAFGPDDRFRVPQHGGGLTGKADEHPHSGGMILSGWLYAYGMTGDRAYLELALPMLKDMIDAFPKIPRYVISKTCESARFLLPLALAWYYTRDARYKEALQKQAEYLRSRMAPCGAIQEEGSNTGGRVEGGDLGLTYDASEPISDQLYCTSFAAMNFWIAYKATEDPSYLNDFYRVTDYLLRIQIASPNVMLDGGWTRGFDYSLWECYGSNADQAWSPYCLETGWTNAIIDIALSLCLTDDTFFETRKA